MANEITVTARIQVRNGALIDDFSPGNDQVTQTTIGQDSHIQSIGFAAEEVVTVAADVATLGVFGFKNLDDTNYVEIGPESAGAMVGFLKLKAGEVAIGRFKTGIVIRAQANTAAVKLQTWVLND
jgi:hypothetical protein